MSVCRIESGMKRKHIYPEGSNQCSRCQHVTTHGANFRSAKEVKKPSK